MATKRFDKRATFLLAAVETRMLQELAARDGLTGSDIVRQLIRRAHAEAFPPDKVKRAQITDAYSKARARFKSPRPRE